MIWTESCFYSFYVIENNRQNFKNDLLKVPSGSNLLLKNEVGCTDRIIYFGQNIVH